MISGVAQHMWIKSLDRSGIDSADRFLVSGLERFVSEICVGNHCFVSRGKLPRLTFNDEHANPVWLLRPHFLCQRLRPPERCVARL